ncbi:hypothetical protein N875_10850 [Neisseria meningitidis LNP21362]|nr:hypothetical protein N875_10850 [Neisseria meningitidis LNP21362]
MFKNLGFCKYMAGKTALFYVVTYFTTLSAHDFQTT